MEESWIGGAKPVTPWHRHLPSERQQRVDRSHTPSIALRLGECVRFDGVPAAGLALTPPELLRARLARSCRSECLNDERQLLTQILAVDSPATGIGKIDADKHPPTA